MVSANARTYSVSITIEDRRCVKSWHLGESGTLGNFLNSLYQGAEIDGRDRRVADQFNEVLDDYDGTTLDFHAAIVESTE